jgi:hypothetical protein
MMMPQLGMGGFAQLGGAISAFDDEVVSAAGHSNE